MGRHSECWECDQVTSCLTVCHFAGHVQACRALMIIALLLGLGAMIVSMLGLKCIKIGSSTDESKGKLAGTGGILAILGGEAPFVFFLFFSYNQQ